MPEALEAARRAERLAATPSETSAARQERASTHWARGWQRAAVRVMDDRRSYAVDAADPEMVATYAFGRASMAVQVARRDARAGASVAPALRAYAAAVRRWRSSARGHRGRAPAALHDALLAMYLGRARQLQVLRCGASAVREARIATHVRRARDRIEAAGDIHVHAAIDVTVWILQAEHELGRAPTDDDVAEIERGLSLLGDRARTAHWTANQLPDLRRRLGVR